MPDSRGSAPVIGDDPNADGSSAAFAELTRAFEEALLAHPEAVSTSYHMFAGRPARLRIVGRELAAELQLPFDHLRLWTEPAEPPALLLDLWDEGATGVRCGGAPEPLWVPSNGDQVTASVDGRFVTYHVVQTRAALDRARRHVIGHVGSRERLTVYERARPLVSPLLLWLMDRDVQALHAGLVSRDGHGALIGGPSGSGKSTVTLVCAQAGFDYLADDCLGLESLAGGEFLGHSLFCSANLEPGHLGRLPALARHALPGRVPGELKSLLLLSGLVPGAMARNARIRVVLLPVVAASERTTVRAASRSEALLRLAPSSVFLLPHARGVHAAFARLGQLLKSVPSYWLELGRDLDAIPARVDQILAENLGR